MVVYNSVMAHVNTGVGDLIFRDAPGGKGKTFLLNLILAKVWSSGHLTLAIASSGIAAQL